MNLKNYTSGINSDVTIARIERLLVDTGATGIAKEYQGGKVVSLVFQIAYDPQKMPIAIKLPANIEACLEAFWNDYKANRGPRSNKEREEFRDQAERTAWKLQQDWVEVQVSLIRLKQQEILQAFLPYAFAGQQTFYEQVRGNNFKALLPPAP
jgi:hypothetical protein